jgi:hypothetical protein
MPFPEQSEGSGFDVIKAHSMLQPEVGRTHDISDRRTVEQLLGVDDYEHYDYSINPGFEAPIGFTQRGCRLKCGRGAEE